jgi:hypothetical protein
MKITLNIGSFPKYLSKVEFCCRYTADHLFLGAFLIDYTSDKLKTDNYHDVNYCPSCGERVEILYTGERS